MNHDEWGKCYSESWTGLITEASFSHPAKYARGLIRRIYQHAVEEGWLTPGAVVLDTFAGVALGALDAMSLGANWIGVELEPYFKDLGAGFDCPGFTKEDWRRFHGRAARTNRRRYDGRMLFVWCDQCVAEIDGSPKQIVQPSLFREGSGRPIPHSLPHHVTGNLELWRAKGLPGSALLVRGDSRRLCEVLQAEVAAVVVSSPPYVNQQTNGARENRVSNLEKAGIDAQKFLGERRFTQGRSEGYGAEPGQLSTMPPGNVDVVIASPPYLEQQSGGGIVITGPPKDGNHKVSPCGYQKQGNEEGQLAAMPSGDLGLVISSPPYTASLSSDDPDKRGGLFKDPKRAKDRTLTATYGNEDGQLGVMTEGNVDLAIASPPYTKSALGNASNYADPEKAKRDAERSLMKDNAHKNADKRYGDEEGQLGLMKADGFELAVSSPPYADGCAKQGRELYPERMEGTAFVPARYDLAVSSPPFKDSRQNTTSSVKGESAPTSHDPEAFGDSPGQLASMRATQDGFDLSIASPPWENGAEGGLRKEKFGDPEKFAADVAQRDGTRNRHSATPRARLAQLERDSKKVYGDSDGRLGRMTGSEEGFDLSVSSPPYQEQPGHSGQSDRFEEMAEDKGLIRPNYGTTEGQLGRRSCDDFWSAARIILEQTYEVLAPGAHAIFVTKRFVRDGQIVDFSAQWAQLCEAVGFKLVHWHRAMLVRKHGVQSRLDEAPDDEITTESKSFFRRLTEQKGSPRIDWEDVLCLEK